jgi:hypothetical protein
MDWLRSKGRNNLFGQLPPFAGSGRSLEPGSGEAQRRRGHAPVDLLAKINILVVAELLR